jgi:threonine synthase
MSVIKESGGWSEDVTDDEIVDGIKLLAETEGIFTETAGGVTMAVTKKLIDQGFIAKDESVVVCITGNGLKTQEAVRDSLAVPQIIDPNIEEFEELYWSIKSNDKGGIQHAVSKNTHST